MEHATHAAERATNGAGAHTDASPSGALHYKSPDGREWRAHANDLPPLTIARLLENGFTQFMTDAGALSIKDKIDAARDAGFETDAIEIESAQQHGRRKPRISPECDKHLREYADTFRQTKFEQILAGTLNEARPGATRLDPLTKEMRRLAEAQIIARADGAHKARPDRKTMAEYVEKVLASAMGAAIRAEAEAELARQANAASAAADAIDAVLFGHASA